MTNATENNKQYIKREQRFSVEDLRQLQVVIRRTGDEEGKEFFADLVDISRRGLKIQVPICVGFAEELQVRIESLQMEVEYEGMCIARHIRSVEEKCWEVGCSLEPHLSEEVIDFVVGVSGRERRAYPRVSLTHAAELKRQGQMDGVSAQIQNISLGGFCLHIPKEHELGEKVRLELEDPDGNEHAIPGRIRWQNKVDDGYLIGCSFVEANSHVILLSCLHESKSEESVNWLVIAAALFAMFLPPAVSLMVSSDGQASQGQLGLDAPANPSVSLVDKPVDSETVPLSTSNHVETPQLVEPVATAIEPKEPAEASTLPNEIPEAEAAAKEETGPIAEVAMAPPEPVFPADPIVPAEPKAPAPDVVKNPWIEVESTGDANEPKANDNEDVVKDDPAVPVKPIRNPMAAATEEEEPESEEIPEILIADDHEPKDDVEATGQSSRRHVAQSQVKDPLEGLEFELPDLEPVAEPPKVDPPKVDPPKVDPPKVDPPKVDPPKVDPPKVDPPKVEVEDPDMRLWRHHSGLKTLKAKLQKVDGDQVMLLDAKGKKQVLPYDWFCIDDLIHLGEIGQQND